MPTHCLWSTFYTPPRGLTRAFTHILTRSPSLPCVHAQGWASAEELLSSSYFTSERKAKDIVENLSTKVRHHHSVHAT